MHNLPFENVMMYEDNTTASVDIPGGQNKLIGLKFVHKMCKTPIDNLKLLVQIYNFRFMCYGYVPDAFWFCIQTMIKNEYHFLIHLTKQLVCGDFCPHRNQTKFYKCSFVFTKNFGCPLQKSF